MKNTSPVSPFRLWMTGSLAVVMVALMPGRIAASEERLRSPKVSRHSPYSVEETLQRIEAAARGDGMSVLMRLDDARHVIVLASSVGGTPVRMQAAGAAPDMPLAVQVCQHPGGGAEVLIAACAEDRDSDWTELPRAVVDDLARLPGMLDRALS
jgi:hypothetical protein